MQLAQLSLHLLKPFVRFPGLSRRALNAVVAGEALLAFPAHALGEVGQARRSQMLHRLAQMLVPLVHSLAGTGPGAAFAPVLGPAVRASEFAVQVGELFLHPGGFAFLAVGHQFIKAAGQFVPALAQFAEFGPFAALRALGAFHAFGPLGPLRTFRPAVGSGLVGGEGRGGERNSAREHEEGRKGFHGNGDDSLEG